MQKTNKTDGGEQQSASYTMGKDAPVRYFDLAGFARFVLKRWWVALAFIVLFAGMSLVYAHCTGDVYTSTAKLYIAGLEGADVDYMKLQSISGLKADYLEAFDTWEVHGMVRAALGITGTDEEMRKMISVESPKDSHLIYVTATCDNAEMAADIANAYGEAAGKFITDTLYREGLGSFSPAIPAQEASGGDAIDRILRGALLGFILATGLLLILYRNGERSSNIPRRQKDSFASFR